MPSKRPEAGSSVWAPPAAALWRARQTSPAECGLAAGIRRFSFIRATVSKCWTAWLPIFICRSPHWWCWSARWQDGNRCWRPMRRLSGRNIAFSVSAMPCLYMRELTIREESCKIMLIVTTVGGRFNGRT